MYSTLYEEAPMQCLLRASTLLLLVPTPILPSKTRRLLHAFSDLGFRHFDREGVSRLDAFLRVRGLFFRLKQTRLKANWHYRKLFFCWRRGARQRRFAAAREACAGAGHQIERACLLVSSTHQQLASLIGCLTKHAAEVCWEQLFFIHP